MTAPQHDAETSMQQANAEQANAEQTNTEPEVDQFTTRQKVQRCWFVTLGLLGGFSFVTSQMGLAMAETDFTIPDYSSGSSAFAAGVADDNAPIIDYSGVNYIEAASSENYSVSASDLSLEPGIEPVAASVASPDQLAPVPEAFIEVPVAPAEVARTLAPTSSFNEGHEQATAEGFVQSPEFTTQTRATEATTEAEAEAAGVNANTTDSESGFIAFEVSPATVPSAVIPTVTPVAPPAFTAEPKPATHKIATNRRPAPSMSGFMETSTTAAPRSAYGHAQASSLSQATLVANVTNVISGRSLRSAAPTNAEPIILAMADAPTPEPLQAVDAAPTTPSITAEVVPDIAPEPSPEPAFVPAPAAPPVVDVTPAAEAPVVQPTEIVPAALPEDINLPEEYNSVFVDPTDYSVGATETPSAEAPAVIISEQSTGCEFTVSEQGSVPNGACGAAPGSTNSPIAEGAAAGGGYNAPAAQNLPEWQVPAPVNAPVANATANAPVSYNPSGIQLSTSAAGRAYLNRSVRPLVNLQAAEQFIFPLAVPSPITSLFGFRIHPIFGDQRFHAGTDIGAEQGTPVLAAQDGIVTGAAYSGGYGLMVVLQHEAEEVQLESRYAHLAEIFVDAGTEVKKGDIIGLVGSTGNSTGPHLHFEMRQMTADGWVLVNADGLIQASLANLVKTLNNPMQTLSFNFSDFNLSNLRAGGSIKAPNASSGIPTFPGNNGIPFRPAQPNAS
ncbi:MAG: peptidoglycan DD-metalloendopeptidase family protein [Cyanobacteria bacterium J06581_3]